MPRPIDAVPMPKIAGVPLYYERRTTTDRWGDMAPNEQFAPLARPHFCGATLPSRVRLSRPVPSWRSPASMETRRRSIWMG
jgi:hypothetical protein